MMGTSTTPPCLSKLDYQPSCKVPQGTLSLAFPLKVCSSAVRQTLLGWLPPYAPDLNPVELLWSYLKYGRLANFAPDTVDEIQTTVGRERRRLAHHPQLLRSFFRHSALPFRV